MLVHVELFAPFSKVLKMKDDNFFFCDLTFLQPVII